ncbi:mannosyl-oligosaccharide glucosidase PWA37_005421 [Arxiozyma heterogenica]|uniref:mannosyl-oligosaccharide glucosidase n=1 Tax=Arxiozyma heterogenica TaxID=278026 RepID=UPI002EF9573D
MLKSIPYIVGTLILLVSIVRSNLNSTLVDLASESLLWAPYRSQCYFGIRPRYINDTPFIMGLMWFDINRVDAMPNLRHQVDMNDKLEKFSWIVYDPRIGGTESIIDYENNVNLTVNFVKSHDGKNWVTRISGQSLDPEKNSAISIITYMNQNVGSGNTGSAKPYLKLIDVSKDKNLVFEGYSSELSKYSVTFRDNYGNYFRNNSLSNMEILPGSDCTKTSHVSLTVPDAEVWKAKDIFQTLLSDSIKNIIEIKGENIDTAYAPSMLTLRNIYNFPPGNFHFIQKTFACDFNNSFQFDIVYNNMKDKKENILNRKDVTRLINVAIDDINAKFDQQFAIGESEGEEKRSFALEILSNLLGGIGYFHGNQLIDRTTKFNEDQFDQIKLVNGQEEGPFDLFTSVPSRAFFPRGFYWDEGFHLLQIMEYDFDLAFEIIISWINMIDEDGWIAREVILGLEARSRVPAEFQVQSPHIANPPTLLLALSEMISKVLANQDGLNSNINKDIDRFLVNRDREQLKYSLDLITKYVSDIYPKLKKHFEWFRRTQRGLIEEYCELLEEDPVWDKLHKDDFYKWVGRTVKHCLPSGLDDYPRAQPPDIAELNVDTLTWVGVMARSMKLIAKVLNKKKDEMAFARIEQNVMENLENLHWSEDYGCYCDISIQENEEADEEEIVHICHEGYVSLLPFGLKMIPRDSSHLDKVVRLMADKDKLFSPYGLLSLSKSDEYFGTDENYWRGKIWLNINYLCLDAINHYFPGISSKTSEMDSTFALAKQLFTDLRHNLIDNVYKVWRNTGFVFENYSPLDGAGAGAKQFTGWTSLIVNILGF